MKQKNYNMAEDLYIPQKASKEEKYQAIIPQIQGLIGSEEDIVANLANISAALKETFGFFWVGFYLDNKKGELVLGPFQGPVACTRIKYDKGVCGHSFTTQSTVIVPDVDQFPGHIACSSASKSEIVVPVRNSSGIVIGVLDVDSDRLDDFDEVDQQYLEEIRDLLSARIV
jgi:L-methionine (R)-S-oxide reductase